MTTGHPSDVPLTAEEQRAIAALKRLAKKWPRSLWLFAGGGVLNVMRMGADGKAVFLPSYSVDDAYRVASMREFQADGGDW